MAGEADALNALLRQLEAAHKASMEEINAEKDREVAELKKMVADVLERVGVGNGQLSEHEAKKARLKGQDELGTHHACDWRFSTPDRNLVVRHVGHAWRWPYVVKKYIMIFNMLENIGSLGDAGKLTAKHHADGK